MSREVKFRAWDKINKKMFKNVGIHANGKPSSVELYGNGWTVSAKDPGEALEKVKDAYEIMQYTGLKDKRGKEIYEGDVFGDHIHDPEVVVFWEGCFAKVDKDTYAEGKFWSGDDHGVHTLGGSTEKYETVIGNIYENPELVK